MSFKVAVVLEDPRNDRYIAEPIVQKVCDLIGRPRARVKTVTDPKARGVSTLRSSICDFLERWSGPSDAVVVIVDADGADGIDGHGDRLAQFRNAVEQCNVDGCFVVVAAIQELEVWALWGASRELDASWEEVRAEVDPKERFFEPLLTAEDAALADGGRRRLVDASLAKGWASLEGACPELVTLREGLAGCL